MECRNNSCHVALMNTENTLGNALLKARTAELLWMGFESELISIFRLIPLLDLIRFQALINLLNESLTA